jgi:hypothetical protein
VTRNETLVPTLTDWPGLIRSDTLAVFGILAKALFRSDVLCAPLIAVGMSGLGCDREDFATAPPVDTATTPRHHPTINLLGGIIVLARVVDLPFAPAFPPSS